MFPFKRNPFALVTVLILLCAPATFAADQEIKPPNILLIMADDMGWSDLGCYGSEIPTPNLDRLAREGMLFTHFYNNAKCTTTRASLLTGLYPRNGGRGQELLTAKMQTVAEMLREQGYRTGMSGKWHNGAKAPHRPIDRGFDESYGLWDGCCNFFDPGQKDPKFKGGRIRFFGHNDRRITTFPEDYFTTDAFTSHAIETIKKHVSSGQPFFHYIAYTAPHYPMHAPEADIKRFEGTYADYWENYRLRRHERQKQLGLWDPRWKLPALNSNVRHTSDLSYPNWQQRRMETYAAMVWRMDNQIGRVLKTLDKLGVAKNTLVVFLSDNGGTAETPGGNNPEQIPGPGEFYTHCGPEWATVQNTPFRRYKKYCHEGGIATACLMRLPRRIAAQSRSSATAHIIDLLPTFAQLAGKPLQQSSEFIPIEGVDLTPLFADPRANLERRDPLYFHWAGNRAVIDERWKVTYAKDTKHWELYDRIKDRTETRDLADEHPEELKRLAKLWDAWASRTGVTANGRE